MSTGFPDLNSAPAWLRSDGVVLDSLTACASVLFEPAYAQRHAPWTPLDTAEAWVARIDREAAYERGWRAYMEGGGPDEIIDTVLAALPELMGGESR